MESTKNLWAGSVMPPWHPEYRDDGNDPGWSDQRERHFGKALAMCAPVQKQIALALEVDAAHVTRLKKGEKSAATYIGRIERLQRYTKADPGPLVAAPFAAMCRLQGEGHSDEDLVGMRRALLDRQVDELRRKESAAYVALLRARLEHDAEAVAEAEEKFVTVLLLCAANALTIIGLSWEIQRRRALV